MLNPSIKRIHCIGVGGIGVSALAEVLLSRGFEVSGSDQESRSRTQRLASLGVKVYKGHAASHVKDADLVIYTSAISAQNPELLYAKERGVPCWSRGQLLAELFNAKKSVAVVGSHGKTTTTSIVSHVMIEAGLDPTCMIGGVMSGYDSPFVLGKGGYFVAEGDESDRSFLLLKPHVAIVTNIDRDHLNNYNNNYDELLDAFVEFLNAIPLTGVAIVNRDDPGIEAILPRLRCSVLTFGQHVDADIRLLDYRLRGMHSTFELTCFDRDLSCQLNLPGYHNIMNALASCVLAQFLSLEVGYLKSGLASFPGIGRRFQCRARIPFGGGEVLLVEDYGHHPRAIEVTIAAVREAWSDRRLVMVFQPHRYSRTKDCLQDFVRVLGVVDCTVLLDVYAAGESQEQGVGSGDLHEMLSSESLHSIFYVDRLGNLPEFLSTIVQPDDIILLQGAGNVGAQAAFIEDRLSLGRASC